MWTPTPVLHKSRVEGLITQVEWEPGGTASGRDTLGCGCSAGRRYIHLSTPDSVRSSLEEDGTHARTRCFLPRHVIRRCRAAAANAASLVPALQQPNNVFFDTVSPRLSWRAEDFAFHCRRGLAIRVYPSPQYWETRPQEIPAGHEHTTPIQCSDQRLYLFIYLVQWVATHTLAVRGVCPDSTACRQACVLWIMSSRDHGWFGFR